MSGACEKICLSKCLHIKDGITHMSVIGDLDIPFDGITGNMREVNASPREELNRITAFTLLRDTFGRIKYAVGFTWA